MNVELRSGPPSRKCFSEVVFDITIKDSDKDKTGHILRPFEAISDYQLFMDHQILFERPKLLPGDCEDYAHYEDIAYNIVDDVLETAKNILIDMYVLL